MAVETLSILVFGGAAALRLLLFALFPSLPSFLAGRVEISTPVTSFNRLQEGLYLYTHNVSPYNGGIYHQAPLFLPLFSLLADYQTFPFATHLVYILTDLLSAYALMQIAQSGEASSSRLFTSPRKHLKWTPEAIAAAFLFNPFTIASCISQTTSVFMNCAILYATSMASIGNVVNSIFALSLACYVGLYPILLAPALSLLAYDRIVRSAKNPPTATTFFSIYSFGLSAGIGFLLLLSYSILGSSWEFLGSTYGVQILLPDLTPNVGLWWYFFIEMFDSFREFFLGVFWLHMLSYAGGITIRIRQQPLFVVVSLLGVFAIYQPYPSIADAALFLALLPLYRHIFPLMRYPFVAVSALLYATFLGPAFYHIWVYAGSGNANFFYAITLVWSLGLTILVADALFAVLRDEFEVERPEMQGKEVRQI